MSAREADGLNWLHRAEADFTASHDNGGLVQCLRNEAAYFEQKDKADQAKALRDRAARMAAIY
ncbi:MAG TPA: hypothetical protein VFE47_30815 [Tepidisphaeraceae bacterium]|jgi:hypothetical protein|nr:hypothetical protein [Tepidisphaeraceae bacterium]